MTVTFAYPSVRQAWLTLGALTVALDYPPGGWFCQSLDLGAPTVREVINSRPDQTGADDRTLYLGPRTVTANITALAGAGARIDAVASQFAPFMDPSQRPVLHYILDRPGAAERTLTLRAAAYDWPIVGNSQRDIQLQWVAADPVCRDPHQQSSTCWSGGSSGTGRVYPLSYPRAYPPGGGVATTAVLSSPGDVGIRPLLRVYGPIGNLALRLSLAPAPPAGAVQNIYGATTLGIVAGEWVDIDCANHTVYDYGNPADGNYLNQIDWSRSAWFYVPAGTTGTLTMSGSSTSGITQVTAYWNDGYLT